MNENHEFQVVQPSALEALSRAEIDVSIATARKYPQHQPGQLSTVKQSMMTCATLDEETAASCFYTLPRGGKSIQGPSVRLAEIALACYGNTRAGTRIIHSETTGDSPHVVVQAVVMDLEKNTVVSIEKRRRITSKKDFKTGGRKPIDEDDINLATNACSAIAFRDAVFKVVPLALVKPVFDAARKVAIGDAKTLVTRRADCVQRFAKMGVTKEQICTKLEIKAVEDVTLEHLETLFGMYNAIKEGELIEEVFAMEKPTAKPADVSDMATPNRKPMSPEAVADSTVTRTSDGLAVGAPTEAKKEGDDGDLGPVCAHCGKPMTADHTCEGLQAAITKSKSTKAKQEKDKQPAAPPAPAAPADPEPAGTPAEQAAAEEKERKDLISSIGAVCAQNEVTHDQLMGYLLKMHFLQPKQKLAEAATAKLRNVNKALQNPPTIEEIKKLAAK